LLEVVARLARGVDAAQAGRELDEIGKRAYDAAPIRVIGNDFVTRVMTPAEKFVQPGTRAALLVLLGAVGLVLLIACTNVANLLLARGAARNRDIALRAALGASGWRLVRALMAECIVLALAAGAVGVGIGWLVLDVLVRIRPATLARLGGLRLEPFVLAFTFGLSLVTAVVFGLVPALQLIPSKLGSALRQGGAGVVRGIAGMRLRRTLVAAEMAVSVILLVSAGLLVRSVVHLQHVDVGFDAHNLFSVQLSLPRARYEAQASRERFAEDMLERVRALPGVTGATQALTAPPSSIMLAGLQIRGEAAREAEARPAYAYNFVGPEYFATLGIRMLEGRTFSRAEVQSGEAVIVSEGAVRRFWPSGNALGRQIRIGANGWAVVVGVVADTKLAYTAREPHRPQFYRPFGPKGVPTFLGAPPTVLLVVRSAADPAPVIAAIRAAAAAVDPEAAASSVTLTETALASSIDGPRFNMGLLTAFAVLAVVLAAVGLAAVTSYAVAERRHEIGIRMALGAREGNVRRLVILQGMSAAIAGVVVGVVGALGATKLLSSLLYGVAPSDPMTFAAVAVLLLVVALAASWLPARRATRVDPMVALRAE
jgi:putative ABC transport system permease protein